MKFNWRWYNLIYLVLFFYLVILQIHAIWLFTIDDMYISLRYAKHWVAGYGVVWNIHESPVEGYSNFSFMALAALTLLLNGNPVIILKLAGLVGLLLTNIFIYLITRFWFKPRESLIPCMALLLYKGQIVWAVSGLETTFYEALICGAVYFCFKGLGYNLYPRTRNKSVPYSFLVAGILLSLAGMTRPEAPVLMLLFFLLICGNKSEITPTLYLRSIFFYILPIIALFLPYFYWRVTYFGYLFPNPIYCKSIHSTALFTLDYAYLKLIWPFVLFALPACVFAKDKRHYFLWLPSVVYIILLMKADPIVAFYNRLFLPVFVLLLPLTLQGLKLLVQCLGSKHSIHGRFIYFSLLALFFLFIPKMTLEQYQYFTQNPLKGEQIRQNVVNWLKNHTLLTNTVVLADSGMIPYFSNLNFVDSYCLNNKAMAHDVAELRYELFCQKIALEQPDIIILTSLTEKADIRYTPADQCLHDLLKNSKDYKFVAFYSNNNVNSIYSYEIFAKTELIN